MVLCVRVADTTHKRATAPVETTVRSTVQRFRLRALNTSLITCLDPSSAIIST